MSKAVVTASAGLRLREKPWGRIIDVMPYQSKVDILDKTVMWWKIRYKGQIGWSYSRYLKEVPDVGEYLVGVDFSSWQKVNVSNMTMPDVTIIRFAAGVGLLDKTFGERLSTLRQRVERLYNTDATILKNRLGMYYVFQPWVDERRQFEYITGLINPLPFEFLAIDVELVRNSPPFTREEARVKLYHLIRDLKAYLRCESRDVNPEILIYTSKYMWEVVIGNDLPEEIEEEFKSTKLWVANYTSASEPVLPDLWNDWAIWQYTDRGRWPGVSGSVDLNKVKKNFVDYQDQQEV